MVPHHLGCDARFLENREIACPRADNRNGALAVNRAVAPNAYRTGGGKVLRLGRDALYALGHFNRRPSHKQIARFCEQRPRDVLHLLDTFTDSEDDLGHAVAKSPVMIYFCES